VKQGDEHGEPRYNPAKAAAVALVRPGTAVRRGDHLALWQAWGVHAAGFVGVIGVLVLLAGYKSSGVHPTPGEVLSRSAQVVRDVWDRSDRPAAWAGLIAGILLVEAWVCLTAAAVMSWCARDERFRASLRRALRRLLLLTPHAAVVVAVAGTALVWVSRSQWSSHRGVRIIEYSLPLMALVIAAGCSWSLWVLLKVMGCRPASALCRWPARCEGCGYQLAGLTHRQACPECGWELSKTLDGSSRSGVEAVRGFADWLRLTYQAVRRPTAFGKRMHVLSQDTGHRRCLAISLVLVAMTVPAAVAGAVVLDRMLSGYMDLLGRGVGEAVLAGTVLGTMMVATTAGAALGIAGLTGMVVGWHHGRNLMPAAIRAACYQSGFAVFWSLVFWCNMAVFVVVMKLNMLPPIAARYNIASEKLVFGWHYAVLGLGLLIYGTLIERATKAAKHANW
jgi:hypothetical protein